MQTNTGDAERDLKDASNRQREIVRHQRKANPTIFVKKIFC